MHIILIRGPIVFANGSQNNEATPCIAYAYLSAYLMQQGHQVTVIDAVAEAMEQIWPVDFHPGFSCMGLKYHEIIERIPVDAKVIGFSGMFSGEWPVLRTLINRARDQFPHPLFVLGGEHATALPEYALKDCAALDLVVHGEGEATLAQVISSYQKGGRENLSNINGTTCKLANRFTAGTEKLPRIASLKDIPWPHWQHGYLEKFWALGKSFGVGSGRDMPFLFSRGCPYQCTFCSNPQMWTTKYKLRDVADVIAEIKHHQERFNFTTLQLYDLTAIVKRSWIVEFCQQVKQDGLRFSWSTPSGTRSEVLDEEVLLLMKESGCCYIGYAPETGSPETLRLINKKVNFASLNRSVATAIKLGISCRITLIIGFPHESWKNILATILYGMKMSLKGVDDVPIYLFSPYPGTKLFNELLSTGKLTLNDDYFFYLTSLNGDYFSIRNIISYSPAIAGWSLGLTRTTFTLVNYAIGYLCYPKRIRRTLKYLCLGSHSTTVFEHRLSDKVMRITNALKRRLSAN